jgi:hypothetical protein
MRRAVAGRKSTGTTNGATWPQFLAQCRTQLGSKAGTAAPTPAAVQPQTGSLFPWQQPASPPPASTTSTTGGNQSVMRQCGAQWQAAKAAGTTGGATWPQFLKACRLLRRLRRQRNRVHCFRGSGQPLRLLGAQRRREPRRRRKLSIAVPDRRSFGSMNTRTSTISPALGITGTRKAALTYARRRRKLQAIAPR